MADETETSGNTNFAHIPGAGVSPVSTHGKPAGGSTLSEELAAGTVKLPNVAPTKITPIPVGQMSNPIISPEPSGAKVQSFSPLGRHDTDGK